MKLIMVTTGGTIEKTYDEQDGSLANRETVVSRFLEQRLRLPYSQVEVKAVMSKDSLHMDDSDRANIAKFLRNIAKKGHPIIVLHGTDTMEKTLAYCHQQLSSLAVPIVFTGAMKPFGFEDSDALQNVTEAITCARLLGPGLFLSFHGELFKAPKLRKNRERGTFEHL